MPNVPGTPVPLRLNEFLPDTQQIGNGVIVGQTGWEQKLAQNKIAFALDFATARGSRVLIRQAFRRRNS